MILIVDANGLVRTLYHITESQDPPDVVERFLNRLEYVREWCERLAAKLNESLSLVCCFDCHGKCFRSDILPEYKAQRTHDLLAYEAVDHAREALANADDWIAIVSPKGYEADDMIAHVAYHETQRVLIHSADKDFNQCLVHGRVGILKRSGVVDKAQNRIGSLVMPVPHLEVKQYTHRKLVSEYGFGAGRWVDYQCLVGDSADNVEGAVGIGKVTAKTIIQTNERIEDVDADSLNKRQRENWPQFLERLPLLRDVFTLKTDLEELCHS